MFLYRDDDLYRCGAVAEATYSTGVRQGRWLAWQQLLCSRHAHGAFAQSDDDANSLAPEWHVDEDYQLMMAVDKYLTPSGFINWRLVADVVNLLTTYTGKLALVTPSCPVFLSWVVLPCLT